MKKTKPFLVVLLASLMFLTVFQAASVSFAATKMPAFSLENARDGKMVSSSTFAGKVLLLTFFATWCPPCAEEVPVLTKLHDDFEGAGFSVVGPGGFPTRALQIFVRLYPPYRKDGIVFSRHNGSRWEPAEYRRRRRRYGL